MESQGCEMPNVKVYIAVYLHVHVSRIMQDAIGVSLSSLIVNKVAFLSHQIPTISEHRQGPS